MAAAAANQMQKMVGRRLLPLRPTDRPRYFRKE